MTLEEVVKGLRQRGPTVDVPVAAQALGVSRATLYTAVKQGQAPVRTIKVLGRIRVLTESVVALLEGRPDVTSGEMAGESHRSDGMPTGVTGSPVKHSASEQSEQPRGAA